MSDPKKKFAQPLAIVGTADEQEALIPDLVTLGYTFHGPRIPDCPYLITNFGCWPHDLGFNQNRFYGQGLSVHASSKDLILAIAAMVEGNELHKGEWCIYHPSDPEHPASSFTPGKLYQALHDGWTEAFKFRDDRGAESGFSEKNVSLMPKATVEEILTHFNSPKRGDLKWVDGKENGDIEFVDNPGEICCPLSREDRHHKRPLTPNECLTPIAFELIREYPHSLPLGSVYRARETPGAYVCRYAKGMEQHSRIEFLSQHPYFFKPIFKPDSVKVPYTGGTLIVKTVISDGKTFAYVKGRQFSKEDLLPMLKPLFIGDNGRGTDLQYYPESFNFGCQQQYKGISRESIQKVIDLL